MPEQDARSRDGGSVDAAIARVLLAEQEARAAVQNCAREADAIVEQAQQTARDVARRAAQRTVRVQRWAAERLRQQLAEVEAQQAQIEHASAGTAGGRPLADVIETLAAELTGGRR
jgi:cell division septum initiation protein DivIVA